jgi:Bacterial PH domain
MRLPDTGVGSRVVLHHDLGRAVTVVWLVATAAVVAVQPAANRPGQAAWMLAVVAVSYAVGWYPALVVDDDGLTLVNPLRSNRIPWPAVDDVTMGWLLEVRAGGRRYRSLAVPGPRRMGALWERHLTGGGVLERDGLTALQAASARGEGWIGLGDAAMIVAQRRAARAALTPPGPVVTTVNVPGVVALGVGLVLVVASAVLNA